MNESSLVWNLPDEPTLRQLAVDFGQCLHAPLVVYLQGDLGTGKTTFARALIQGLGYKGRVKSPTYGLLESYQAGGFDFLHLDLYRIVNPAELEFLAIADQFTDHGILLIEWPEKALSVLPSPDILLHFKELESNRSLCGEAISPTGLKVLRGMAFKIDQALF